MKITNKRLNHVDRGMMTIWDGITSLPSGEEGIYLLQQYEEQLSEFKSECSNIHHGLLPLDLDSTDPLLVLQAKTSGVEIKNHTPRLPLPLPSQMSMVSSFPNWMCLPSMAAFSTGRPFGSSSASLSSLIDSDKLAYCHALKGGSAKSVIEGLSRSGDHYNEAVTCLKSRYDRPRLIHQAHVRKILETPNLKDGSGRELCRLRDAAQQHLRALKALGHEPVHHITSRCQHHVRMAISQPIQGRCSSLA